MATFINGEQCEIARKENSSKMSAQMEVELVN